MKDGLERAALVLSTIAAISIAGVIVKREVFPPISKGAFEPVKVKNWETYDRGGVLAGSGATTLIVFSDYQCPACRTLEQSIQQIMELQPSRLRVRYRHYPLEQSHPYARTLAIGAECASADGKFDAYHRAVFASQDSLTQLTVMTFAERSGVSDTAKFRSCMSSPALDARIEEDVAAGDLLGLAATPTFILGGKRFVGSVTPHRLDSLLKTIEGH